MKKYKHIKKLNIKKKKNNRINVMNLNEFKVCLKKKLKGCVHGWTCTFLNCNYYHIYPDAHCNHTYNGTLCPNIIECGKIHIQRCINELPHYKNNIFILPNKCPLKNVRCCFLHRSDLPNDIAKQSFVNTINKYRHLQRTKLGEIQDDEDDTIFYI